MHAYGSPETVYQLIVDRHEERISRAHARRRVAAHARAHPPGADADGWARVRRLRRHARLSLRRPGTSSAAL